MIDNSDPAREPIAWLVQWGSRNGETGQTAYTDKEDAERAAKNLEMYRTSETTAGIIPLYATLPVPERADDLREALTDEQCAIICRYIGLSEDQSNYGSIRQGITAALSTKEAGR